ncbi:MAG: DUF882 domain-containing protein [Bacteroidales bacterium]|nr:DUF882 domain-containing protein [Bacteroidales bacterium]
MAIKTYAKGSNTKLSTNFNSSEFDCHGSGCCSSTLVDDKLVTYLQQIREHFGKPVNISSGYRCATHNKNIGGATNSRHSKGQAADIYINGVTPAEIAKYAESIGILGIGLYETNSDGFFVHVDTRETKSFWYGQKEASRTTFGGTTVATNNKIDTSAVKDTAADPKVIWDYFKAKGLNDFGIAGLMGNLYAESGLKPTNLQNTYEKKLGYTDAEYTAAVDQGKYTNFVKDSAGYGLAQWTYWSRKQNLLDFAQSKNKSIGDLNMQLDFLYKELSEGYKNSVLKVLCEAKSVLEASNSVLLKFERPADQSETVQNKRAGFGQTYYDKYAGKPATDESSKPATTPTTGTNTGGTKMKYNSSNKPLVCMQTNSTCYKGTRTMTVLGVLWHSTGANNPWLKRYVQPSSNDANYSKLMELLGKNQYGNDWNHIERQAGLNCWIGKLADGTVTTVQTMPWNYRPWGCGSGSKGSCNSGWIQFEICEDALTDKAYFDKVYKEGVEITAYLCKMYNLNPKGTVTVNGVKVPVILDHQTSYQLGMGGNHGDVQHWFKKYGKTLDDVRNDVAKLLNEDSGTTTPPAESTPSQPADKKVIYRVRKSWKDAASQKGAYSVLENAKKCCDQAGTGYYVFDEDGNIVYPKTTTSIPSTPSVPDNLKAGDEIKLVAGATYVDGKAIPNWVFKSKLYCRGFRGEDVVFSTLKTGAVTGVVKKTSIQGFEGTIAPSTPANKFPYLVIIDTDVLNVRAGASTATKVTAQVKRNQVYTIVAEDGEWGKLKSGAGWINLKYTKKK